jgi:hypothetical protein
MPSRRTWLRGVLVVPAVLLALTSCTAAPMTRAAAPKTPTATSTVSRSTTWETKRFSAPFTVTVDRTILQEKPIEGPNLVSWNGLINQRKIRFLVPASIWVPGAASPSAPPKDYLAYLHDEVSNGIQLSNESSTTVDGHHATLVTVATDPTRPDGYYDGSTGCIDRDEDESSKEADCFGFQANIEMRLVAVVPLRGRTLLAWARSENDAHSADFNRAFESMLHSIHFR